MTTVKQLAAQVDVVEERVANNAHALNGVRTRLSDLEKVERLGAGLEKSLDQRVVKLEEEAAEGHIFTLRDLDRMLNCERRLDVIEANRRDAVERARVKRDERLVRTQGAALFFMLQVAAMFVWVMVTH